MRHRPRITSSRQCSTTMSKTCRRVAEVSRSSSRRRMSSRQEVLASLSTHRMISISMLLQVLSRIKKRLVRATKMTLKRHLEALQPLIIFKNTKPTFNTNHSNRTPTKLKKSHLLSLMHLRQHPYTSSSQIKAAHTPSNPSLSP